MFHVQPARPHHPAPRARRWLIVPLLLALPLLAACGVSNNPDGWAGPIALDGEEGEDVVVTRAGRDQLIAVDLASRSAVLGDIVTVRWEFPDPDERFPGLTAQVDTSGFYGAPAFLGPEQEEIVFSDYDAGIVYALRTDGSSARVLFDTEDRVLAGILVDGSRIYIATTDERIYAIDAENPPQNPAEIPERGGWVSQAVVGEVWGTPALADSARHGRLLVVPAMSGNLYALRADDGALVWTFATNAGIASTIVAYDGRAYIGGFDHMFYAIDLDSGQQVWAREGDDWFWTTARIDERSGTVYAGDLAGKVWAWRAADGEPLWPRPYDAEGRLRARPLLLDDPAALVVVTRSGDVHAIDPRSGVKIWASSDVVDLEIPDRVLADPLSRPGFILVSNDQGCLFEVRVGVNAFRELVPEPPPDRACGR